jgi:predicted RNA-binding protein with PIN domain
MALLIDGYNLLNVTDLFGVPAGGETALHASRRALLDFLSRSLDARTRAQTTIVFDAGGAPPGLPRTLLHEGITAQFARQHSDADELMEEIIDSHPDPKSLTVISSDHRIQRAARRRGAAYVDSERWYAEVRAMANAAATARPAEDKLTPDQVSFWLDQFGEKEKD